MIPRVGDVVVLSADASSQFRSNPIHFRVITVDTQRCGDGWAWMDGYQLDPRTWDAVARRQVLVFLPGVYRVAGS